MKPTALLASVEASAGADADAANAKQQASALPEDVASDEPIFELPACDSDAVVALQRNLGLHPLVAQTLARRGIVAPAAVKEFLEGGELHDATLLPGAVDAARAIAKHVRARSRIAVHGDYDVDGVCSTAILVRTLDRLGSEVTWHVPSRFAEGYGLSRSAIDRLAADGAELIVAVDCGITAVAEAEHAATLGVELVVCDHHTPGDALPAVPIVHPALPGAPSEYPCPWLCAAAVTFKLCQVLVAELAAETGVGPEAPDHDLDLVGLATACDVVPLVGENRELVKRGIAAMRTTRRPGLRELMRVSGVDPLSVDAGAFGYRLGPRINAVGRMFSAEPAVELLLTSSERRGAELAEELSAANARRKDVEQSVLREAEVQARRQRDGFAIVVAGEGWHAGVLGIVAGRIAERYRRPCVVLGVENGVAAGSARSGGAYDLIAGLDACAAHLIRYGGHRAAAGLQLDESAVPAFTRALREHAAAVLCADDLRPRVKIDAVADPGQLTLDAAEALAALGPFGVGNPQPALLVPAVTVTTVKRMGEAGRHLRLGISGYGARASVVAFGWDRPVTCGDDAPLSNLVVKLRRNEFRGVVEGQARLVAHAELPFREQEASSALDDLARERWRWMFHAAFDEPIDASAAPALPSPEKTIDRSHEAPLALLAELDAGDGVALVVGDVAAWEARVRALAQVNPRFSSVQVLDAVAPPPMMSASAASAAAAGACDLAILVEAALPPRWVVEGAKRMVVVRGGAHAPNAGAAARQLLDRSHVVAAFRAIRDASDPAVQSLAARLAAEVGEARVAAHAVRVLHELGLVRVERSAQVVEALHVTGAPRTELDRSPTFRSYSEIKDLSRRWLAQLTPSAVGAPAR